MKVNDEFLNRLARIAYVPATNSSEEEETEELREIKQTENVKEISVLETVEEVKSKRGTETEQIQDNKESRARKVTTFTKGGDVETHQPFWRTVHCLASQADKMLGLDKKTLETRKQNKDIKYELDSALLEANMWLNM